MTEDQIAQACPFCLGNCNCRTCLRMEGRLRHGMSTYFSVGSEERFNHTRYLLNTIIPFLKQFNQEQMMEKEVEAKIQGVPESAAVQEILYHQRKTMEMMYSDIAAAIERKQLNEHPTDYLSFFCLGNREVLTRNEYLQLDKPDAGSNYFRAQLHRRFMIYVHSKMMIVDDEYIIIGSANINQRSMDGGINTEIAMGAFQPNHLAGKQPPKGHIFGFRMSLWCEHLRQLQEYFAHPETIECIRELRMVSEDNWKRYTSEIFEDDLPCHLLCYPLLVTSNGNICAIPGVKCFPDTKASVLGSKSSWLFNVR
ncbi:phospholipase D alpha 1-like isoform X2 [Silene latifolia]